jgi:endogenous inhibitor of DNA gyrase (YacG/DUF329 family)
MEDRDQAKPDSPPSYLEFTCPTCKRRVRALRKDPAKLPKFFPFCSARCKWIDLGSWLDAQYRIPSKPDEESEDSAPPSPEDAEERPNTEDRRRRTDDRGRKGGS